MGTMLVDNHQARFHGGHDILALILIMRRRFLCNDTAWRCSCTRFLIRIIEEFHRMLLLILVFQPLVELLPVWGNLRFGARWSRKTGTHRLGVGRRMHLERIVARVQTDLRSRRRCRNFRIINRNLRFILRIEIDGRHIIEHANAFLHCRRENLPDGLLVLKLDFGLGRMNVDIDVFRIHLEIEEVRHLLTQRYQSVVSCHYRLVEIRVLHVSSVDKEELMNTLLPCRLRLAHKAPHLAHGGFHIHRQQVMIELLAKDIQNTLAQIRRTKIEHLGAIAAQGKGNLRIHQGDALKGCQDIIQFGGVRLEELSSSRNIIEDVAHREDGSHGTGTRLLPFVSGSRDGNQSSNLVTFLSGFQFHLRHCGDRGESLTTESHGAERKEIVCLADFRGRMTLESQSGIGLRHSLAIINDLDIGATGIHHRYMDIPGTCIHSVLNQLLDYGSWTLYHLSCRYLIGNRIG